MTIHNIPCKLVEKEGKKAQIEIEGQIIKISSEFLPKSILPGEIMYLNLLNTGEAKRKEENLAKLILEEILNGK